MTHPASTNFASNAASTASQRQLAPGAEALATARKGMLLKVAALMSVDVKGNDAKDTIKEEDP